MSGFLATFIPAIIAFLIGVFIAKLIWGSRSSEY
jgi:uncharacterized membrane protein